MKYCYCFIVFSFLAFSASGMNEEKGGTDPFEQVLRKAEIGKDLFVSVDTEDASSNQRRCDKCNSPFAQGKATCACPPKSWTQNFPSKAAFRAYLEDAYDDGILEPSETLTYDPEDFFTDDN